MVLLEVCCTSLDSALSMLRAGAQRLEICSYLSCGGLTPTWLNLLHPVTFPPARQQPVTFPPARQQPVTFPSARQQPVTFPTSLQPAAQQPGISLKEFLEQTHVLIRCRPGNFCYSHAEVETMCESIRLCRQIGVRGVVIGALTSKGDPDLPALSRMIHAATGVSATTPGPGPATASTADIAIATNPEPRPLTLVFHRAFDECRDPFGALEQIINLSFSTILTSGQAPNAEAGIPMLCQLVDKAAGRITIMAGKGVTADNVAKIIRQTGVPAVHLSERPGIPEILVRI